MTNTQTPVATQRDTVNKKARGARAVALTNLSYWNPCDRARIVARIRKSPDLAASHNLLDAELETLRVAAVEAGKNSLDAVYDRTLDNDALQREARKAWAIFFAAFEAAISAAQCETPETESDATKFHAALRAAIEAAEDGERNAEEAEEVVSSLESDAENLEANDDDDSHEEEVAELRVQAEEEREEANDLRAEATRLRAIANQWPNAPVAADGWSNGPTPNTQRWDTFEIIESDTSATLTRNDGTGNARVFQKSQHPDAVQAARNYAREVVEREARAAATPDTLDALRAAFDYVNAEARSSSNRYDYAAQALAPRLADALERATGTRPDGVWGETE